jgi:hypothetical protein
VPCVGPCHRKSSRSKLFSNAFNIENPAQVAGNVIFALKAQPQELEEERHPSSAVLVIRLHMQLRALLCRSKGKKTMFPNDAIKYR